ncbi:LysR family transcriptional regulator [Pinisolibacter sp.]|uniref:LysR family transcriptional regulator n=1 Tax=Pinisolibacter sp. TaxID=2172024 RepID=UPI002FDDA197
MRIDFLGIEAFLAIAERGSFHGAAAHLNLSQTALSHRMRKLEDDLGVELFTRTTRRVALTPAGVELLPKARRMLDEISAGYEALRNQGRERQERLAIGCLPTIATSHLPPALEAFSAAHPTIRVLVHDASAQEIADRVQKGEAEFGITVVSAGRWDLEVRPLLKEPYVLACARDHPLAMRPHVSWSDFEGQPLVRISSQTANRAILDEALGSRREAMFWRYEVSHLASAMGLVRQRIALAVVPRLAIDDGDGDLLALPIRGPSVSRTLGIVTKRGLPLSSPGKALLELVVACFRGEAERPAD